MKLAEALIARKENEGRIQDLWRSFRSNLFHPEDEVSPEDPAEILRQLDSLVEAQEALILLINLTNVKQRLKVGDEEFTLMEAVLRRDRLKRQEQYLRDLGIDSIRQRRGKKEDLKYVAALDVQALRLKHDGLAKRLREFDVALQEANWKTELKEGKKA